MQEKLKSITDSLSLPGALIGIISGIISISKDTPWYIYTTLFVLSLVFLIYYFYQRNNYSDFDILNQDEVIDLTEYEENIAHFSIECLIKSLKDNAQNIDIIIGADGSVLNPEVERGVIENIKKEGGRNFFSILFPNAIKKGNTHNLKLECKLKDTFNDENEFWEINKYSKASNVKLTILFPENRKPKTIKGFKINGHKKVIVKEQPRLIKFNKNTALLFEIKSMSPMEKYRVEWCW